MRTGDTHLNIFPTSSRLKKSDLVKDWVKDLINQAPPLLSGGLLTFTYGAFRQIAAEGRKINADGHPFTGIRNELERKLVEACVQTWNSISPHPAYPDHSKFPEGWRSFNPWEEVAEGGLASLFGGLGGMYLGKILGERVGKYVGKNYFHNEKRGGEIGKVGGTIIGGVIGALGSYEIATRLIGPALHTVLHVPDVKFFN